MEHVLESPGQKHFNVCTNPGVITQTTKLRGVGFVKQVGFKPGVKARGSYGWAEWWIKRRRTDRWRNRSVGK